MRVAIVGAGFVGSTVAYALLHKGLAREVTLIDRDRRRAEGEAMDLTHALPFLGTSTVKAAGLGERERADLVVIAAGRTVGPEESRLDLLRDNGDRIRAICAALRTWKGVAAVVMVSNPVDVLTQIASDELGWKGRVLGTGTALDTARLKSLLGERFLLDPRSIEGYILGEHGESEFAAWSTLAAGGVQIRNWPGAGPSELASLFEKARGAGQEIIRRKGATYFAIGAVVAAIAEAVLKDARTVLPVSVPLAGQYGLSDVSLSLPCVIGGAGVSAVLEPPLEPDEVRALRRSAAVLQKAFHDEAPGALT